MKVFREFPIHQAGRIFYSWLIVLMLNSIGNSQEYDPSTGDIIQEPDTLQFDPVTGMPLEVPSQEQAEPESRAAEPQWTVTIPEEELRRIIRAEIDNAYARLSRLQTTLEARSVAPGTWYRGVPSNGAEGILVYRSGAEFRVRLYGFDEGLVTYEMEGFTGRKRANISRLSEIRLADGTLVYSEIRPDIQKQESGKLSLKTLLGVCCLGFLGLLLLGAIG